MKKITSEINLTYTDNAEHQSAHYTCDGIHYLNGGEFAECIDKHVRGFEAKKDANVPYDIDSDIPELSISIKSARAGLTDRKLADNLNDFLKIFFEKVHSKYFDWVVIVDNQVTIYTMTKSEFVEFTNEFIGWDKYAKKARFGTTTTKMLSWFECRVAQALGRRPIRCPGADRFVQIAQKISTFFVNFCAILLLKYMGKYDKI